MPRCSNFSPKNVWSLEFLEKSLEYGLAEKKPADQMASFSNTLITGLHQAGKTPAVRGLEGRVLPQVRRHYFATTRVPTSEEMTASFRRSACSDRRRSRGNATSGTVYIGRAGQPGEAGDRGGLRGGRHHGLGGPLKADFESVHPFAPARSQTFGPGGSPVNREAT